MRAVVQRVSEAKVKVNNNIVGSISRGLLVFLGVGIEDSENDLKYLSDKVVNLRIFEDNNDKMNLSLIDVKGELLVVSQFTLFGDLRKGKRPNFMNAAHPQIAEGLYEDFIKNCASFGIKVERGLFGEHMEVELINDGPVTIMIDSKKNF